ncbi:putative ribokinase [Cyclospora cayetanensis]|nr:putative ribokinase [Cyclospora cayetanensis]
MTGPAGIVVIGCINSDIVAFVSHLPHAGETVFSSPLEVHFGGKGANQAAQVALLLQSRSTKKGQEGHQCALGDAKQVYPGQPFGHEDADAHDPTTTRGNTTSTCGVAMVGRVGRDTEGSSFLRHFSSLDIDTRGVSVDSHTRTGTALVTVAKGGENTIAYVPGANAFMSKEHLAEQPVLSLLQEAKVVVSENGIPGEASVEAFRIAKGANAHVLTVFTPAPVDRINAAICCFTDFLLCNSVEAQALLKLWGDTTDLSEPTNEMDMARLLHERMLYTASQFAHGARGLANVIITRGANPCVVFANGKAMQVPVAQHVPSELVVDTTGAGDAFAGAFAYFLLLSPKSPELAVSRATYVAAQSVTKNGAAESYAGRGDLPEHLFRND